MRATAFACAVGFGMMSLPAQERRDNQKPLTDEQFVMQVASCSQFEIQSSTLAKERASDKDVKSFAEQMIKDHTKNSKDLMDAAKGAGIAVAGKMDAAHQKMLDQLKDLRGTQFDTTYINQQVKAHDEAVALFTNASKNLKNPALKKYAESTLPVLKKHQEHVKTLDKAGAKPGTVRPGATPPGTQPRPAKP
jgi:putative membrane protein